MFETTNLATDDPHGALLEGTRQRPRSNLIFRNPDGTPKTDASARVYPLDKVKEEFSLLGKDKAEKAVEAPTAAA